MSGCWRYGEYINCINEDILSMKADHWLPSPLLPCQHQGGPWVQRGPRVRGRPPEGLSLRGSPPPSLFLACQLPSYLTCFPQNLRKVLALEVRESWSEKDGRAAENPCLAYVLEKWLAAQSPGFMSSVLVWCLRSVSLQPNPQVTG